MKVRTRPLLVAAALLAGALVPLAAPAAADTGPVPLGMSRLGRIVVDEAHGLVFLSPGPGGSGVQVTDLGGQPVATLDGLPSANGMALTADARSLWVAVPSAGLVRLSTTTLAVEQRIALPTGHCAGDVAISGSRLVYGHSCTMYLGSGGYGGVGVVDAATGAPYGNVTTGPSYKPVVASGPAGQVYAADALVSPTSLSLYDVSGASPQLIGARAAVCSNLRDLSASPDGAQVVTSCGSPYEHTAYSAAKLVTLGTYKTAAYPLAGAWSANGRVFAGGDDSAYGTDVSVFRAGGATPDWVRDFGSTSALLQPRGLALSADGSRAWAVTRGASGGLDLRVLQVPGPSATTLTLASDPPSMFVGERTDIGGWLSWGGVGVAGVLLTVTRTATGAAPVTLPSVTTRADGTYTFADSPEAAGTYTYTVTWAGDSTRGGATATEAVTVHPLGRTVELRVEPWWNAPSEVSGRILLRYSGSTTPPAQAVQLTRQVAGTTLTTALPPVTTDQWGHAEFRDLPPAGTYVYTASVAAEGVHPAATATATVTVPAPTTLTVTAPATAFAGSPLTVSGVLSSATAPVAGAAVSVGRSGCSSASWSAKATTTPNGAWSVIDSNPPSGTCTYAASYAGSTGQAPSSASATTVVSLRPTTLTATAPTTAVAGTALTVRGGLTSGSGAVVGAPVHVLRSGCSGTSWSASAVTAADGTWSVVDPEAASGTCTYRASFQGSSTHVAATASVSVPVSLRTTDLTLSLLRGTGSAKKSVIITGQLGAWHVNRTLTITVQPASGPETFLASGTVDSTGRFTATYTPRTTTTYRVKYTGDDWYAPATAVRTQ